MQVLLCVDRIFSLPTAAQNKFFEVLSEQCSELYRRVFGYCSDRKGAGDFACPFGVASVEKV